MTDDTTPTQPDAEAATPQPDPAADDAQSEPVVEPAPPATVIARYIGDGTEFMSNVPNRDITDADIPALLTEELLDEAVASGLHERV